MFAVGLIVATGTGTDLLTCPVVAETRNAAQEMTKLIETASAFVVGAIEGSETLRGGITWFWQEKQR